MSTYIYYGQELYHHGILGQKWGIRRFQNQDGTYTEEGKLRRREDSDKSINRKKIGKAPAVTAGAITVAAAAMYVSKHPEVVAKVISKAKNTPVNSFRRQIIEKGNSVAKEILNKSIEGFKAGLKEAPYKVAKTATEGAAIMVAKDVLDVVIGKENNEKLTEAYNAYNNKKAGKIGEVPSFRK